MAAELNSTLDRLETAEGHDEVALSASIILLEGFAPALDHTGALSAQSVNSTDAIVHLIDVLVPGWSIHIAGKALETDGHWRCTLRRSSARDNDEFIGQGKGKILANALLAALLRTASYSAGHNQIS